MSAVLTMLAASAWRAQLPARAQQRALSRCVGLVASSPPPTPPSTLNLLSWLDERFKCALVDCYGPEYSGAPTLLTPATRPEFGDYQCNIALSLSKKLGAKPRDVATAIGAAVRLDDVCETPEVAGPGFLNIKLQRAFVKAELFKMICDPSRCAVGASEPSLRVVVDYSSPNIAKEMHVGHLRSTIIGDTLAKVGQSLAWPSPHHPPSPSPLPAFSAARS